MAGRALGTRRGREARLSDCSAEQRKDLEGPECTANCAGGGSLAEAQPGAGRGLVFHRADGQPLYQTWLKEQHANIRLLLRLSADCVPHSFRHTYGTRLGETGADAFTIMRLMAQHGYGIAEVCPPDTRGDGERGVSDGSI
jgi:integrase